MGVAYTYTPFGYYFIRTDDAVRARRALDHRPGLEQRVGPDEAPVAYRNTDSMYLGPFHFERSESNVRAEVALRADRNELRRVDGAVELAEDDSFPSYMSAGPPPSKVTEGRKGEGRFAGRDEQFAPDDARLVRRDEEP